MAGKKVLCPLCGNEVAKDKFQGHFETEKYVLERISKDHPDWKETDGGCTRCIKYYLDLPTE